MTLVPKREYVLLLLGDAMVFTIALWMTLVLRYLEIPSWELFFKHLGPFSILFALWLVIFFLAGLYGKHTRIFRSQLSANILSTQIINMTLAAVFFFLVPTFGLAPKTILVLYLFISFAIIYSWRVSLFPRMRFPRKLKGVLIASGPDAQALAEEVASDALCPFSFVQVVDSKKSPSYEVIQQACRMIEEDSMTFLVGDFSDKAFISARPIIYNAAFNKKQFAVVDIVELYQEVFDRVPLSFRCALHRSYYTSVLSFRYACD